MVALDFDWILFGAFGIGNWLCIKIAVFWQAR